MEMRMTSEPIIDATIRYPSIKPHWDAHRSVPSLLAGTNINATCGDAVGLQGPTHPPVNLRPEYSSGLVNPFAGWAGWHTDQAEPVSEPEAPIPTNPFEGFGGWTSDQMHLADGSGPSRSISPKVSPPGARPVTPPPPSGNGSPHMGTQAAGSASQASPTQPRITHMANIPSPTRPTLSFQQQVGAGQAHPAGAQSNPQAPGKWQLEDESSLPGTQLPSMGSESSTSTHFAVGAHPEIAGASRAACVQETTISHPASRKQLLTADQALPMSTAAARPGDSEAESLEAAAQSEAASRMRRYNMVMAGSAAPRRSFRNAMGMSMPSLPTIGDDSSSPESSMPLMATTDLTRVSASQASERAQEMRARIAEPNAPADLFCPSQHAQIVNPGREAQSEQQHLVLLLQGSHDQLTAIRDVGPKSGCDEPSEQQHLVLLLQGFHDQLTAIRDVGSKSGCAAPSEQQHLVLLLQGSHDQLTAIRYVGSKSGCAAPSEQQHLVLLLQGSHD
ncbi:hypothetical protein WJX74_002512 [Apatococcus lobatus]|uniref:Uncharacterized protein n=1 Tax=Apatococcus lobatus TaxID=904363 RepID=A0AAW1Q9N4_9CHLO